MLSRAYFFKYFSIEPTLTPADGIFLFLLKVFLNEGLGTETRGVDSAGNEGLKTEIGVVDFAGNEGLRTEIGGVDFANKKD